MALIADTSGIIASVDRNDPAHKHIRTIIEAEPGPIVIPDLVLAEVDYMLLRNFGREAEEAFLADVVSGGYAHEPLEEADLIRSQMLIERYREHDIGLVDATIVATAERLGSNRVLTLDLRHFRMFRFKDRRAFRLLPADKDP